MAAAAVKLRQLEEYIAKGSKAVQDAFATLRTEQGDLKSKSAAGNSTAKEYTEQLAALRNEVKDLKKQKQAAEKQIATLEEALDVAREDLNGARDEVDEKDLEILKLQKQVGDARLAIKVGHPASVAKVAPAPRATSDSPLFAAASAKKQPAAPAPAPASLARAQLAAQVVAAALPAPAAAEVLRPGRKDCAYCGKVLSAPRYLICHLNYCPKAPGNAEKTPGNAEKDEQEDEGAADGNQMEFDDGDDEEVLPATEGGGEEGDDKEGDDDLFENGASTMAPATAPLTVGMKVRARWGATTGTAQNFSHFYPGRIIKVHPDKTVDIHYDDGDKELNVRPYFVQALATQSKAPAAAALPPPPPPAARGKAPAAAAPPPPPAATKKRKSADSAGPSAAAAPAPAVTLLAEAPISMRKPNRSSANYDEGAMYEPHLKTRRVEPEPAEQPRAPRTKPSPAKPAADPPAPAASASGAGGSTLRALGEALNATTSRTSLGGTAQKSLGESQQGGGQRVMFSVEESSQLRSLYAIYGPKWAVILKAGQFHPKRTSVSLKDRARQLGLKQEDPDD